MTPKNTDQDQQNAEVRKHYYLDQYVVIAPKRSKRPKELHDEPVSEKTAAHHPIEDDPSVAEIKGSDGHWDVKVVDNSFPAFSPDNQQALGKQEIVLETDQANTPFAKLSVEQIIKVLHMYKMRAAELSKQYKYVSIFKNHGHAAGASLAHTHSQIIAIDMVPPTLEHERKVFSQYQKEFGTSAMCDVVRWELEQQERIVVHSRLTTTLTPYASQFPLEAWVIPNRQADSICDLTNEEIRSLADHLKGVAVALASGGINFNFYLQERLEGYYNHFAIMVTPRINIQAGFELNTDIYINPVSPEFAAQWYRKYIKTPN